VSPRDGGSGGGSRAGGGGPRDADGPRRGRGRAGRPVRRPDGAGHWRRGGDEGWEVEDEQDPSRVVRVPAPSRLGAELGRLFGRPGWTERLGVARLASAWAEVVGPELAAHCEPVRISGRVLTVRAATAPWATQLKWLTVQLAERASALLGPGSVTEVHVVVGPLGAGGPLGAADPGTGHTGADGRPR
jgi:hypothetical protein